MCWREGGRKEGREEGRRGKGERGGREGEEGREREEGGREEGGEGGGGGAYLQDIMVLVHGLFTTYAHMQKRESILYLYILWT